MSTLSGFDELYPADASSLTAPATSGPGTVCHHASGELGGTGLSSPTTPYPSRAVATICLRSTTIFSAWRTATLLNGAVSVHIGIVIDVEAPVAVSLTRLSFFSAGTMSKETCWEKPRWPVCDA